MGYGLNLQRPKFTVLSLFFLIVPLLSCLLGVSKTGFPEDEKQAKNLTESLRDSVQMQTAYFKITWPKYGLMLCTNQRGNSAQHDKNRKETKDLS